MKIPRLYLLLLSFQIVLIVNYLQDEDYLIAGIFIFSLLVFTQRYIEELKNPTLRTPAKSIFSPSTLDEKTDAFIGCMTVAGVMFAIVAIFWLIWN